MLTFNLFWILGGEFEKSGGEGERCKRENGDGEKGLECSDGES